MQEGERWEGRAESIGSLSTILSEIWIKIVWDMAYYIKIYTIQGRVCPLFCRIPLNCYHFETFIVELLQIDSNLCKISLMIEKEWEEI